MSKEHPDLSDIVQILRANFQHHPECSRLIALRTPPTKWNGVDAAPPCDCYVVNDPPTSLGEVARRLGIG